jgi:hypothetical protein
MSDEEQVPVDAPPTGDGSTLHHLDAVELKSLGFVAVLFYATAFFVLALAITAVWLFAAALGLISQVEDFMRSVGFRGFRLVGPEVVLGFVLLLLAVVLFLTVMTLIAGAFYNLLGTGKNGIRVRTSVVDSEDAPAATDAPAETPVDAPSASPIKLEAKPEGTEGGEPEAVAG